MSRCLATKANLDRPLLLWNRTIARAHGASAQIPNTAVAASAREAVQASDIIWSCLSDGFAVLSTYESVLEGDVRGKLFVECSTISTEAMGELAGHVAECGAEFVAMPGE